MSLSLDVQKPHDSIPTAQYDVVVLGAGPYGLSAASHLKGLGLKVAAFGKPLHLWRNHMPEGMLLRSYWWATSLSDPEGKYSFARYFEATGKIPSDPLPMETFIDYGLWFQKNAVPELDETYITHIVRQDNLFVVTLEDGRVVQSKAVVMAPGLQYYAYAPKDYEGLPSSLVSHSADHSNLGKFAGKRVAVVGRGQAALESAAILNESGATVTVISRSSLRWVPVGNSKLPAWLRSIRAPQAGMGNGWTNWILEKYPYLLHRAPRERRDYILDTTHGPAGSHWLKPRILGQISVKEQAHVEKAEEVDGHILLTLSDGEKVEVDHVLLGTGYRPDVKKLTMLDQSLIDAIQTHRGSPVLSTWFETGVPGLYFTGFSAARSFGPYYRFVVGAGAASRRVSAAVARYVARVRAR